LFLQYDSRLINVTVFNAVLNLQQEHEVGHALVNHLQAQMAESLAHISKVYPKVSGLAAWSENCKWYSPIWL